MEKNSALENEKQKVTKEMVLHRQLIYSGNWKENQTNWRAVIK